jgi:hypothetical protein
VAWNGNYWVAGGSGTNSMLYSTNGTSWQSNPMGNNMFGVTNVVYGLASRRPLPYIGTAQAIRRTLYGSSTTSSGTLTITFSPSSYFSVPPTVTATITGSTAGFITVNSITASNFVVNTFNTAGTLTNFTFNWIATL